MKIGIDCRLWNETGVGRYIRNLVWELEKLDKNNNYVLFVKKGFKIQDLGFKNERWKVIETDITWHTLEEQTKFPPLLNKENLDLMHFPYFSHPVFYNKPFVVTIHDLIINQFPTGKASTLPYPFYLIKRSGYAIVMNHAVNKSKKVIVPLNAVKDDVIKTLGVSEDKVVVTYEGVEENSKFKIQNSKFKNQKYFLYVGNAYPHKNLELLVDEFLKFRKELQDEVTLVLVGKNDFFYKRLHSFIEKKNLQNIIFQHDVSDEELFALYSNALAFVSASKMEGFGLPPLEAMSSRCLVILSDIPSFREVCGDSAFYFDLKTKNSLKEIFASVYDLDQKKRQEYVEKGLKRVKDFSWKKMAEETLEIYNQQISKSTNKPISQ